MQIRLSACALVALGLLTACATDADPASHTGTEDVSTARAAELIADHGAVVLDIRTGDVLAMASRPGYDPNVFLPYIGEEQFAALRDDPAKPLFPRAFAGVYPPASTFKVVTALAALDSRVIHGASLINSPGGMRIGGRWFKNWHSGHEGRIGVERALARSCNTWFYRVGMDTGAANFCSVAHRLGFGAPTGLPLAGEAGGLMPTEDWMQEKFGQRLADGYLANAAIGQGHVLKALVNALDSDRLHHAYLFSGIT